MNIVSLIELELDFVEEGLQFVSKSKIIGEVNTVVERLNSMVSSYAIGKIYREGVKAVLCGRPNVGKSSIFNRLLHNDRAIVTNIPGTTRDTIEESISINGMLFTLNDTAGLRVSSDQIENEGVSRAEAEIQTADILLFIIDLGDGTTEEDRAAFLTLSGLKGKKILVVQNKCDLMDGDNEVLDFPPSGDYESVKVSAVSGYGFEHLKEKLFSLAINGCSSPPEKSVIVTNVRHLKSLNEAVVKLEKAKSALDANYTGEFIAPDLRAACDSLGGIIGEVTSDEILYNIFSKFCIGK